MKYHEVVKKKKEYNRLIREKTLPIEHMKKSQIRIKRLTIIGPAKPL